MVAIVRARSASGIALNSASTPGMSRRRAAMSCGLKSSSGFPQNIEVVPSCWLSRTSRGL